MPSSPHTFNPNFTFQGPGWEEFVGTLYETLALSTQQLDDPETKAWIDDLIGRVVPLDDVDQFVDALIDRLKELDVFEAFVRAWIHTVIVSQHPEVMFDTRERQQ